MAGAAPWVVVVVVSIAFAERDYADVSELSGEPEARVHRRFLVELRVIERNRERL
jgi:hypothetical protein